MRITTLHRHKFDPAIVREYDIRGVVGGNLGAEDALALGLAFGTTVRRRGGKTVAVGCDGRLTSPALVQALCEGLTTAGCDVREVGCGPSPMLYFAVRHLGADGGVMVTGSHNPAEYNGFKLVLGKATIFGSGIKRLAEIAAAGDYTSGKGVRAKAPVIENYVQRLLADAAVSRRLKIAWDPGNGAAAEPLKLLCAGLRGEHHVINGVLDGRFPAHHPDPTVPENLRQLQDLVADKRCDLGIAFDGDADRIGVVDDEGAILWGDQLMVLYAGDVLAEHPGATIIADIKASQVLFDEIARLGGAPLMWKTGHSLIKAKMTETGALLAGEMSGHIFFADRYYGFDDALYAAIRLIQLVANSGKKLSQLRAAIPSVVNTPELRIDCADARKFRVVEEVRDRLARQGAEVNGLDGVRVKRGRGWWLLRASNTQPVLVARCEATDARELAKLKDELIAELRASGVNTPPL
jgi:phosphomannomutase